MKNTCEFCWWPQVHLRVLVPGLSPPTYVEGKERACQESGSKGLLSTHARPASGPTALKKSLGALLVYTHEFRECVWKAKIPLHCLLLVSHVRVPTAIILKTKSMKGEVLSLPVHHLGYGGPHLGNGLNTTQSLLLPQILQVFQNGRAFLTERTLGFTQ